ncbi:MAG: hypothetical protein JXX14_16275, partial [Deltaproteobacteria bacterium]|nr:hypothetical protein [Deltaproteobacteria bacterium]
FVSRRSELADALVQIGGKKVIADITGQMTSDQPITNGLSLLASIRAISKQQTVISDSASKKQVAFVGGVSLAVPAQNANQSIKLHFQLPADSPTVTVRCNNQAVETLRNVSANTLQTLTVPRCDPSGDNSIAIESATAFDSPPLMMAIW